MDIIELIGTIMEKIPKKQEETRSAQETLLLDRVWQDGMVRVHGTSPVYSKTIRFSDINYTLLDEDSRRSLLDSFGRLFHLFEDGVHFQMTYEVEKIPPDGKPEFCGKTGESLFEVETHLMSEYTDGSCSCSILFFGALFKDAIE